MSSNNILSWSHALKDILLFLYHPFSHHQIPKISKLLMLQFRNFCCASFRSSSSSLMLLRSCLTFNCLLPLPVGDSQLAIQRLGVGWKVQEQTLLEGAFKHLIIQVKQISSKVQTQKRWLEDYPFLLKWGQLVEALHLGAWSPWSCLRSTSKQNPFKLNHQWTNLTATTRKPQIYTWKKNRIKKTIYPNYKSKTKQNKQNYGFVCCLLLLWFLDGLVFFPCYVGSFHGVCTKKNPLPEVTGQRHCIPIIHVHRPRDRFQLFAPWK